MVQGSAGPNIQKHDSDDDSNEAPLLEHEGVSTSKEWSILTRLAWPIALTELFMQSAALVNAACLGHLVGTDAMAAETGAEAFMMLTQVFAYSAGSCLNTLCSQARGAGNLALVGYWCQLGLVVYTVLTLPVFAVWGWGTHSALRSFGMAEHTASMATTYARYRIPGAYAFGFKLCLEQYYESLDVVRPAMVTAGFSVAVNLGLNFLFISGAFGWDGMGFKGCPIATSIAQVLQLVTYAVYCGPIMGYHRETWKGFDRKEVFKRSRVKEYLSQSFPTALGALMEQGQFQLLTVFTAHMSTVDMAAWNAVGTIWGMFCSASFGFNKAVNLRVSYHLGLGDRAATKQVILLGTAACAAMGISSALLNYFGRNLVASAFTSDDDLHSTISSMAFLVSIGLALLMLGVTGFFVLDGQGRPGLGAVIIGIGAWVLNIPGAALVTYKLKKGLKGILVSVLVGYMFSSVVAWAVIALSDWDKLVREAKKRSEAQQTPRDEGLSVNQSTLPFTTDSYHTPIPQFSVP